jgi:hypothetical protein
MKILDSFFSDHIVKHLKSYERCWNNNDFERLTSNEDKDRAFLECHENWISSIKGTVRGELETRVRDLL